MQRARGVQHCTQTGLARRLGRVSFRLGTASPERHQAMTCANDSNAAQVDAGCVPDPDRLVGYGLAAQHAKGKRDSRNRTCVVGVAANRKEALQEHSAGSKVAHHDVWNAGPASPSRACPPGYVRSIDPRAPTAHSKTRSRPRAKVCAKAAAALVLDELRDGGSYVCLRQALTSVEPPGALWLALGLEPPSSCGKAMMGRHRRFRLVLPFAWGSPRLRGGGVRAQKRLAVSFSRG